MRLMQQELRTSLRELSLSERFAKLQTRVGHITEFIAGHGNDHAFHPQNDD